MEYQLGPVTVGENVSVYDMYTTVPRKVTGNYSNLYIRFTMQRYVSKQKESCLRHHLTTHFTMSNSYLGNAIHVGLLLAQHAPGGHELGLLLAGSVRRHTWPHHPRYRQLAHFHQSAQGTGQKYL